MPLTFKNSPILKGLTKISPFPEMYLDDSILQRNMETPNVSIELEAEFRRWWYGQAIFINAPTGTGKSTFVIKVLLRYVMEHGGRVLIVYNRLALGNQYKELVLKEFNSELRKRFTTLGLQETNRFEGIPVTFCTYQGLSTLMGQDVSQFTYVVFDECHYFCSDTLFARKTWSLLEQLLKKFSRATRVYMTATPWAVQNLVARAEQEYELPLPERIMRNTSPYYLYPNGSVVYDPRVLMYVFPEIARNYKLQAISSEVRTNACHKSLVDLIKKSPANEKWVIFIDSKDNGQKLAKTLGNDAVYLDAEHKGGEAWAELTTKSEFSGQILITTPVADCGVNINDPAVKHVVLFSVDHVQFVQMLGRKRLRGEGVLHVYVPELSPQQWMRMKVQNDRHLQIIGDYYQYPHPQKRRRLFETVYEGDDNEARHLLYDDSSGKVHLNRCAEYVVRQRDLFYQELEDRWEAGDKHPFLRIVYQWMGLPETALADALGGSDEGRFIRFLDAACGRIIEGKEEQNAFSNEFRTLFKAAFGSRETGSRRKEPWGANIIRSELDKLNLPYSLTVKKGIWQLTRNEEGVSTDV